MSGAALGSLVLETTIVKIVLAAALGLFLGLEREWSHQPAGIRTFSLISLLAAVFMILEQPLLLVVGGLLIVVQGGALAVEGLFREDRGLGLTTGVSMLIAYGVGALVGAGYLLEGTTVAILSSLVLVLKRELHRFAWGLTREELRSTTEFAVLAFVIYPLLPSGDVPVGVGNHVIPVEPRVIWLMVVTVAAIGIVNYVIVRKYGGRGVVVTGFFGGLASSTAVVGTMLDHVDRRPALTSYAVAAIMLADAAMALRNLTIALAFTWDRPLVLAVPGLGAIIIGGFLIAAWSGGWAEGLDVDLESPFSLRNAFAFGFVFLLIVIGGAVGSAVLGRGGFYLAAAISGLVSSAGVTTSAIVLFRSGSIAADTAVIGILLATGSSVGVKAFLTTVGGNRRFARMVLVRSAILILIGTVAAVLPFLFAF